VQAGLWVGWDGVLARNEGRRPRPEWWLVDEPGLAGHTKRLLRLKKALAVTKKAVLAFKEDGLLDSTGLPRDKKALSLGRDVLPVWKRVLLVDDKVVSVDAERRSTNEPRRRSPCGHGDPVAPCPSFIGSFYP